MKKILLFLCILIGCMAGNTVLAQTWRWGISGGSSDALYGTTAGPDETVQDMTTDANGNLYVVSNVGKTALSVDGHARSGYGYPEIMVSSFSCNGAYRWSKIIGGISGGNVVRTIKTDSIGGVYITGIIIASYGSDPGRFDTDTTIGTTNKSFFIIKYDTAGTYQWLRMPQSDTVSPDAASYTGPFDMDVDGAGNSYTLCQLLPGAYAGGSLIVTDTGMYIMKYNSLGVYQSLTPIQISIVGNAPSALTIARDHANGRCYVTGIKQTSGGTTYFNGIPITKHLFIGAFNGSGTLLWYKENTSSVLGDNFTRPTIDDQHDIYLCGTTGNTDSFNSYAVVNTVSSIPYQLPLIVKLDTNGNNIWAKNLSDNGASMSNGIIINGSEVAVAGSYPGKLVCPGFDSVQHITDEGYGIFLVRLNTTTGAFTGLDTLGSPFGDEEYSSGITSDKNNNVYVGGNFNSIMYVNGTTLSSVGGGSDFFAAKFGYDNCGCTYTPSSSYTSTGTSTVTFTYTGSVTGMDSVVWTYGDGAHGTGTTSTHTYTASGTYNACATVYTACGNSEYCNTFSVTVTGCTAPPVAAYTHTGSPAVSFTYSGTAPALDSVVWHYGDGTHGTGTTAAHTYTIAGTYTACVTAYNACGSNTYCDTIVVPGCTAPPVSAYTRSGNPVVAFTYTGSMASLDSVVWNYGDGAHGTGTSSIHVYTAAGTYTACATAYTSCGSNEYCDTITIAGCTAPPVATFTHVGNPAVTFAYTGSVASLDSVVWAYGDGHAGAGLTTSHIYTATGTYTVCVTAYTACGHDEVCDTIRINTAGVPTIAQPELQVYPNPTTGELTILHAAPGTVVKIYSLIGQQVYSGTITADRQLISITSLPPGSYILQVTDNNGSRINKTVIRQ